MASTAAETGEEARKREGLAHYLRVSRQHRDVSQQVRRAREALRDVRAKYDRTEEDLKALQSVGQIIGEVLRPLSEETFIVKASSGPHAGDAGHDHFDHYAHPAARGGPAGAQDAHRGRCAHPGGLFGDRRARRSDSRVARSGRAAAHQPGAVCARRREDAQGRAVVRTARHRQDVTGARHRLQHRRALPQSGVVGHCGQVHRRVGAHHPRDVHRGHLGGPRDPAHADGAVGADGRLRRAGGGEDHHGHQPTGRAGRGAAATRPTGPQDRGAAAQRAGTPGGAQDPRPRPEHPRRGGPGGGVPAGGRLQRRRPAQRLHRGGHVRHPRGARPRGGRRLYEGGAQTGREQETRVQDGLRDGVRQTERINVRVTQSGRSPTLQTLSPAARRLAVPRHSGGYTGQAR
eukprot:ctg_1545.g436